MPEHIPDSELTVDSLAKKTYLRIDQRRDLEQGIRAAKERLEQPMLLELTGGDPDMVRKQLARENAMLDEGTPPQLSSTQTARICRLEQHLRDQIMHAMPTFTMMERARPTDIDHHVAWEREHKRRVLAWKTCLLMLDPHNTEPNFLSIARLRSDTVKGDPRRYTQNFDQIKWEEVIEDDLIRDLDDGAYQTFLEYKLLGWSKPSIYKAMAWTPAIYEAAMERLRRSHHAGQEAEQADDEKEQLPDGGKEDKQDDELTPETETSQEDATQRSARPTTASNKNGRVYINPNPGTLRIKKPKHWLRDTLKRHGQTIEQFTKETLSYKYPQTLRDQDSKGSWTPHFHTKVELGLEQLAQAEPATEAEPATTTPSPAVVWPARPPQSRTAPFDV